MDRPEADRGRSSPEDVQLNRNRSFKTKQLVRSQAIRESQSPPRTISPIGTVTAVTVTDSRSPVIDEYSPANDVCGPVTDVCGTVTDIHSSVTDVRSLVSSATGDERTISESEKISCGLLNENYKNDGSYDIEEANTRQQVEIQITSGAWDEPASEQRQRTRRWLGHRQRSGSGSGSTSHDLLSNNPMMTCVCGGCGCRRTCPDCRGRRRRHPCPAKQDSGIGCSDECPDCSDTENVGPNNDSLDKSMSRSRKSESVDLETNDQQNFCRCSEHKERPKSITLIRADSDDRSEPTGADLVNFIRDTLNKNPRDRMTLLKIERELHSLVNDTGRCIVRFPVMTSYGRMLVHRCASLFQLGHHLDQLNRGSVLVSKSGTSGGRIPCTAFREWCTTDFPPSPHRQQDATQAKSILKRDAHSLDDGTGGVGGAAGGGARSKSLEQREREYERVRRRIFSSEENQWSWLNSGTVKLLTPDTTRNKLLKVQSLETAGGSAECETHRGAVSKSHSFGGYGRDEPAPTRVLSRQGDLASSSWRLSPSSSGYKTLSLRSTDSVTPSPTGGVSPEPTDNTLLWAVTDLSAVPPGALIIHPQTGRPLTNPDGSEYRYDPSHPPVLYAEQKVDTNVEKRRGRLEKQHSFIDNAECEYQTNEDCRTKNCCCTCKQSTDVPSGVHVPREEGGGGASKRDARCNECDTRTDKPPPHAEVKPIGAVLHCKSHYETDCEVTQNALNAQTHKKPEIGASDRSECHSQESQLAGYPNQAYKDNDTPNMQHASMTSTTYIQDNTMKPVQTTYQDPNIRPISLSGMVYSAAVGHPGYPYGAHCRMEPQIQATMYHHPHLPNDLEHKLPPSPHHPEPTFRIDQSYPYPTQPIPESLPAPSVGVYSMNAPNINHYGYAHNISCAGACGVDPVTGMFHCVINAQRGFGMGYAPALEGATSLIPSGYPIGNVIMPQPPVQQYPYTQALQWPTGMQSLIATPTMPSNCATPVKSTPPPNIYLPQQDLPIYHHQLPYKQPDIINYPNQIYPVYPNFGYPQCVVPQMMPQSYPICPILPVIEKSNTPVRRNSGVRSHESFQAKRHEMTNSKKNYVNSSSRNTPLEASYTPPEDKQNVPYDKKNIQDYDRRNKLTRSNSSRSDASLSRQNSNELAAKIQQIKDQMAQLNVQKYDRAEGKMQTRQRNQERDRQKCNSGNGILGNYPVGNNHFNNRIMSNAYRPGGEDMQLSSAARAIVNTIRNLQAKNNLHKDNSRRSQDYQNTNRPSVLQQQQRHDIRPPYAQSQENGRHQTLRSEQSVTETSNIPITDISEAEQTSERKMDENMATTRNELNTRIESQMEGLRVNDGNNIIQDGGRIDPGNYSRNRPSHPVPPFQYRPYMFRQMSPGTWYQARRSPGPLPPGMNQRPGPRRPPPDTRNGRR